MNGPQGYSNDRPAGIKPAERPRIAVQIEQINKTLACCHEIAGDVDRAADRLLGPVPQDVAKAVPTPPVETLERKLAEVLDYAQSLESRLRNSAQRINSAV